MEYYSVKCNNNEIISLTIYHTASTIHLNSSIRRLCTAKAFQADGFSVNQAKNATIDRGTRKPKKLKKQKQNIYTFTDWQTSINFW